MSVHAVAKEQDQNTRQWKFNVATRVCVALSAIL